MKGGIGEKQL